MTDLVAARVVVTEARAAINQAAKSDASHRDLEGDFESADLRLGEALEALDRAEATAEYGFDEDDDHYYEDEYAAAVADARGGIEEALELLETPESRGSPRIP